MEAPRTLELVVPDVSGNRDLNKEIGWQSVQEVVSSSGLFYPPQSQQKTGNLFSGVGQTEGL